MAEEDVAATSARRESRFSRHIGGPIMISIESGDLEVSLHECRTAFLRETEGIFPGINLTGLLAIPTMQRAKYDLVRIGDEIEAEKDRLLETVGKQVYMLYLPQQAQKPHA